MARGKLTEPGDWHFSRSRCVTSFPQDLDQLLRCPICFEYYEATMMFPQCSHNFCSLCIRRYLSGGKTKCPMCAKCVTEGDLKKNRLVDQLVEHFKSSREALLSLVQSRGDHRAKETAKKKEGVKKNYQETSSLPMANTRCGHHGKRRLYSVPEAPDLPDSEAFVDDIISSSAAVSRREDGEEGRREDGDSSDTADVAQSPSFLSPWQPGDVRERKRPQLFGDLGEIGEMRKKRGKGKLRHFSTSSTPSRLHNDITPSTSSPLPLPSPLPNHSPSLNHNSSIASLKTEHSPCSDKAACPVCDQLVLVCFINRHLDGCLRNPDSSNSQTQRKYAKIPRLVYQIMKDRQLKSKLKEHHLPTHGDRQVLIGRLKEFILRFNAQCDSLNPRPRELSGRRKEGGRTRGRKGN
ncbi:E3 ubiquitin-protein ligase RAD18 [Geodia barretti]|uniref:RING-type E3 ubiquitin transferase n=1 Tax=Geodia barretti TaxID=519541 RepID=A0AA35T5M5_GEOBA|nr:E3 ubiquitin-protein ligase RAD18 [Geodia barretti]